MIRFPSLSADVSKSLSALWTRYAGTAPTGVRTEIRGSVLTCVLADGVADFNRAIIARQTHDTVRGVGRLTATTYKREAVAAVTKLTRQRVASFVSSHDRDTDAATEIFTLEPSFARGSPRVSRRSPSGSMPPPRA